MSEEQKIRPKGSMCANCTHKDETCNLDFASMPKISRDADGWDVVRCTRFERAEKVKDVHTEHCCSRHGCKYGKDDECTVMIGIAPQSYPCEFCDDPEEKRIAELETELANLQMRYEANTAIMHARTKIMNQLIEEKQEFAKLQLHEQIMEILKQRSIAPHEYINPNFLSDIIEAISVYYELENDQVVKWMRDMYGA